jgi:hypothetical protein
MPSWKPSALGAQSALVHAGLQLDQRATSLLGSIANGEGLFFREVSEPSRNQYLAGELATRPDRYLKELRELTRPAPAAAFCNVRAYGDGRPSHLGNETEPFVLGKTCGQHVDRHSKVLSVRPASELPEVLHWSVILGSAAERKPCIGRRWCVERTWFVVRGAWCFQAPLTDTSVRRLNTLHPSCRCYAPRTTHYSPRLPDAPRTTHHAPRVLQ